MRCVAEDAGALESIKHCMYCLWMTSVPCALNILQCWVYRGEGHFFFLHVGAVAPTRAIVAVKTEMSERRALEQFTTEFSLYEGWVLREPATEHVWQALRASLSVFMYSERDLRLWHLFFPCSEMEMSQFGFWLEHYSSKARWRLLTHGPRLQMPSFGLAVTSLQNWSRLSFFIWSQ